MPNGEESVSSSMGLVQSIALKCQSPGVDDLFPRFSACIPVTYLIQHLFAILKYE